MAGGWFESVAEAQRRAERRLPCSVDGAIWAGSEFGLTLKDNVGAFGELGFAPHVAGSALASGASARPKRRDARPARRARSGLDERESLPHHRGREAPLALQPGRVTTAGAAPALT